MSYTELSSKFATPKKEHQCEWCVGRIAIGEKSHSRAYIFDGDFQSGYTHLDCYYAMVAYFKKYPQEDIIPGDCARGRMDNRYDLPPEFKANGHKINEHDKPTTEGHNNGGAGVRAEAA